eukprot:406055-Amphidinium_carterae.1
MAVSQLASCLPPPSNLEVCHGFLRRGRAALQAIGWRMAGCELRWLVKHPVLDAFHLGQLHPN